MAGKTLTRAQIQELIFSGLKEYKAEHLPFSTSSLKGFDLVELAQLYAFLQHPEIKNPDAKRPKCPLTPDCPSLGSTSITPYKTRIARYIEQKAEVHIEYPNSVPVGALEAIANRLDSLE